MKNKYSTWKNKVLFYISFESHVHYGILYTIEDCRDADQSFEIIDFNTKFSDVYSSRMSLNLFFIYIFLSLALERYDASNPVN